MSDRIKELEAKVDEARGNHHLAVGGWARAWGGGIDARANAEQALSVTESALIATAEALGFERAKQKAVEAVLSTAPNGPTWEGSNAGKVFALADALAALRALDPEGTCAHYWIDATNEVVSGTMYCSLCGRIQPLDVQQTARGEGS